jgi:hypothetical protein
MKQIVALVLLTLMTACAGLPVASPTPPAPLQKTVIDEKGLIAAYSAFDVALSAVDGLVAAGVIVPGSPRALQIKGLLITARTGLDAASSAQKAGSAATYAEALQSARDALSQASSLLRKGN